VAINLEQLRQIAQNKRNAPLIAGVRVSVTSAIRIGGMEVIDPKRFPLVEIRARVDACPFCRAMNRKVFRKDAFSAYLPPFHINCRCIAVHLQEGVAQENLDPNEVEPLLRHAHFVADRIRGREVRYEALQIPARVEGRDFIFRRVKDPATGQWVTKLQFRPPPEREMPGFFLQGLLPPPGERPVVSLQVIGRTLRQIPSDAWQEGVPNVSALVVPPKESPLVRRLKEGNYFWERIEGNVIVLNTEEILERLSRLPEGDNGAQAFMATLRAIFPELHKYMTKLPVSACVKLVSEMRQYARVLELINRVHKIPAIKVIDVVPDPQVEGYHGAVMFREPFGVFNAEPTRIVIKTPAETPLTTIAHEIGHLLDVEAIGMRRTFATELGEEVLREWWQAVSESRLYQKLMEIKEQLRDRDILVSDLFIEQYLATRKEFFARSYAQYIATKTRDRQMLREIRQKRTITVRGFRGEYELPHQWEPDDFRPIAEALDRLFERLGWR